MEYIDLGWLQTVNSALLQIGAREIISLSDGTTEAKQASMQLPFAVAAVMSAIPFNMATTIAELNQINNIPGNKYAYTYKLPTNLVRINECETLDNAEWQMLNRYIVTNSPFVLLKYIELPKDLRDVPIVCWYPITLKLAALLASSLARNESLAVSLDNKFNAEIQRLLIMQGKQQSQTQTDWTSESTWIKR